MFLIREREGEREMGVTAAFKVITEMKPERAAAAVVLTLDP